MHSTDSIYKKVNLPQFTIKPEFLKIQFPLHAAGPLRPRAEEMTDERKSKRAGNGVIKIDYATKWEKFEKVQ